MASSGIVRSIQVPNSSGKSRVVTRLESRRWVERVTIFSQVAMRLWRFRSEQVPRHPAFRSREGIPLSRFEVPLLEWTCSKGKFRAYAWEGKVPTILTTDPRQATTSRYTGCMPTFERRLERR